MKHRRPPLGLVTGIGGRLLAGMLRTVRFETAGEANYRREWDRQRPVLFALWHGHLVPLSWYHRSWNLVTLISESADGEAIARVVERWGYTVVRGSSSRGGGRALRQLIRQLRDGRSIAVTPDGPRGPREKVKPGILAAAQATGVAIVPVVAVANRAWWVEGWDRFMIPQPFSRIRIVYGQGICVPREAAEAELLEWATAVENALKAMTLEAEAAIRG